MLTTAVERAGAVDWHFGLTRAFLCDRARSALRVRIRIRIRIGIRN
jgi:hypothetical protein